MTDTDVHIVAQIKTGKDLSLIHGLYIVTPPRTILGLG